MIITQKIGNLKDFTLNGRSIDPLVLEWYETSKRILHKTTNAGREIRLKFLNQNQHLTEGDILYHDNQTVISIEIRSCDCITISPATMYEMAYICYEIGNKHLPLFYENDELLIPYELPLLKLLQASGLNPRIETRKLIHRLNTTVSPHGHPDSKSLFSRILQLTSSNE